jgi:hypothetical protein
MGKDRGINTRVASGLTNTNIGKNIILINVYIYYAPMIVNRDSVELAQAAGEF